MSKKLPLWSVFTNEHYVDLENLHNGQFQLKLWFLGSLFPRSVIKKKNACEPLCVC